MSRREEILEAVSKVVTIPSCVSKASSLMDHPGASLEELGRVIEHDPGLTINLLKVVNASDLGQERPVLTARDALDRLGNLEMLRFVVSTGVAPSYVRKIDGYDQAPTMHLQHSVTVALCARELGRALQIDPPDHVFTAGLLAGVGKLFLGAYVEVETRKITHIVYDEGLAFDRAEEQVLGITHAELGGILLKQWGLPSVLSDVVTHHLRPDEFPGEDPVLDLVHVGNVMAKMIGVGLGADGLNYVVSNKVVERLGIDSAILDRTLANVVVELDSLWDLFLYCAEDSCLL